MTHTESGTDELETLGNEDTLFELDEIAAGGGHQVDDGGGHGFYTEGSMTSKAAKRRARRKRAKRQARAQRKEAKEDGARRTPPTERNQTVQKEKQAKATRKKETKGQHGGGRGARREFDPFSADADEKIRRETLRKALRDKIRGGQRGRMQACAQTKDEERRGVDPAFDSDALEQVLGGGGDGGDEEGAAGIGGSGVPGLKMSTRKLRRKMGKGNFSNERVQQMLKGRSAEGLMAAGAGKA